MTRRRCSGDSIRNVPQKVGGPISGIADFLLLCDYMPDDCLPIIRERKNFKKLDRDEKLAVKEFIADIVAEYWNEKRQIPAGESLAVIKKTLIRIYQETYYVILKDDTELKTYLRDHTIAVINRLLREERQEKEE